MKKLFSLLFMLLPLLAAGQAVKYSYASSATGTTVKQLQETAKEFLTSYFKTAKQLQLEEKEGEIVVRKATQKLLITSRNFQRPAFLGYDLILRIKDGQYTAEFYNTTFSYAGQLVPGERFLGANPPEDMKEDAEFLKTMGSYQLQTRSFVDSFFKELDVAMKSKRGQ